MSKANRSFSRLKQTSIVVGLVGIIVTTSACSGGTAEDNSPANTSTPTTIAQATQTPTPSMVPPLSNDKSVALGELVKTTKGEYRQVKLPEDSPSYKYNPAIVKPEVLAKYSEAEIKEAQKEVMDFTVKEIIDSPINGAGETKDQWWERNGKKFTPLAAGDAYNNLGTTNPDGTSKSIPSDEPWQQTAEYQGYEYKYDSTIPRVKNLVLAPKDVFLDNSGGIAFTSDISYEMPYTFKDKFGDTKVNGELILSVEKSNGKWLINGFDRLTTTSSSGLTG